MGYSYCVDYCSSDTQNMMNYRTLRKGVLWALLLLSTLCYSQSVKTYIPPQALQFKDIYILNQEQFFPRLDDPSYFMALTEHESCISLKHSKCWNASSKLQSKRELGIGLSQLTKTYREDGTIRFDTLTELRQRHKEHLSELSWLTVEKRPDLQIKAMYLLTRDNYVRIVKAKTEDDRWFMTDAAYNAGYGSIQKRKTKCSLTKGCDPTVWEGNLAEHCPMTSKPLYGKRSACDINNHHVYDVFYNRMPKYQRLFQ